MRIVIERPCRGGSDGPVGRGPRSEARRLTDLGPGEDAKRGELGSDISPTKMGVHSPNGKSTPCKSQTRTSELRPKTRVATCTPDYPWRVTRTVFYCTTGHAIA